MPRAAHDRPTSRNDGRAGGDVEVDGRATADRTGGEVSEVANAVIWLCSPGSSLMTGHHIILDGGMTATA